MKKFAMSLQTMTMILYSFPFFKLPGILSLPSMFEIFSFSYSLERLQGPISPDIQPTAPQLLFWWERCGFTPPPTTTFNVGISAKSTQQIITLSILPFVSSHSFICSVHFMPLWSPLPLFLLELSFMVTFKAKQSAMICQFLLH